LIREFEQGTTLEEMCEAHGRTVYGIISRLEAAGLIVRRHNGHYYRVLSDPWELSTTIRDLYKSQR
jgi:DNA-binding PadR family transcriptional regulator